MEESQKKKSKLWTLFKSNFIISACTFGGGAVIIPIFKKKYVDELHWIEEDEMMDMIAIAQSAPGVMAGNTAIIIGYRIQGIIGAICSVLGAVLPPMIILSLVSFVYEFVATNAVIALILKGMAAGVAAVMINVSIDMSKNVTKKKNVLFDIMLIVASVLAIFFGISVIYLIIACAVISLIYVLVDHFRSKKGGAK